MKKSKILGWVALGLMVLSLVGIVFINRPTSREKVLRFPSTFEGKTSTLEASYYEVKDAEYAALICPGFSCDRQKLRPIADQFVSVGVTSMTFDYSGQGASTGVIGFGNAKSNHIPTEISHALKKLHEVSGIPYDHIVLVGHSMGGRSILKLFTLDIYEEPVGAAMLIAPEVDYVYNLQASLFTGTSDETEEPWKSYDGRYTKDTAVYLMSSTFDDTVPHPSTIELFRRLGGKMEQTEGVISPMVLQTNSYGARVALRIVPGALHSYQMYAPAIKEGLNTAISDFTGLPANYFTWANYVLYGLWFLGFVGLFLLLKTLTPKREETAENLPKLTNFGRFIGWKVFLWLPALLVMFLICCVSVVMPFGSPVLNIVFMGSIAGYGAVMFLAYRKGRFKGTEGKLLRVRFKVPKQALPVALGIATLAVAFAIYEVRAGLYRVMPFNFRVVFLLFAGLAMTVGYYISGIETDMLRAAKVKGWQRLLYQIVQYVPILLYTLSYIALGSVSGLVEQAQNLMFMYVFALPLGRFFTARTGNRLYGAALTAFSFQMMMLMSTALIAVF